MTDDKRNRGTSGQSQPGQQEQQGQQQQGQFGQSSAMQPNRQQSQQGRHDEPGSEQQLQADSSGSNRQAQQAHPNRREPQLSSQRSGGVDEAEAVQGVTQMGQSGTKPTRTWTQTSGGQQATQASIEGGQQQPGQQQGQTQQQEQSRHLQQNQPEVRASTEEVREQMEQRSEARNDSQGWHPPEGSHQEQRVGSQGGVEDAGTRRQRNRDARSQATGEMLDLTEGMPVEENVVSTRQRSLAERAGTIEEQREEGYAGTGLDIDNEPGAGGQRAEAIADRIENGEYDGGRTGGRPRRRR